MNSYIKPLEFESGVWKSLMLDLKESGRGKNESGAFLLAERKRANRVVCSWLSYDVLSPGSLTRDYVRLEPEAFTRLWSWCQKYDVEVVADVHTHLARPVQSISDRAHPMIALPCHIALIAPFYAQYKPRPFDCSFNIYHGDNQWTSYFNEQAEKLIIVP